MVLRSFALAGAAAMLAAGAAGCSSRNHAGGSGVIVVSASGPLPGLVAGWEALRQRRLVKSSGGRVFRARGREVQIETDPSRLVEIDGSVVGATPIKATIRPDALTVIVPAPAR